MHRSRNPCERLITRRTKAITPSTTARRSPISTHSMEISRAHSIPLVEDCAHVPGAQFRARGVGTHGALGCFSFQIRKPMTAGEGGMITHQRSRPRAAMPVAHQLRTPPPERRLRRPADGRELPDDGMAMRNSARAAAPPARTDRAQEPRRRPLARRTRRNQGTKCRSRAIRASRAKQSMHSFFSSRNPRSASRAIDSSAHFAPRASRAASPTNPVYRFASVPA